jgi:regulator of replication initiation timing
MDDKTELLLDYYEMAILGLRNEVDRLTIDNKILKLENKYLTYKLKNYGH